VFHILALVPPCRVGPPARVYISNLNFFGGSLEVYRTANSGLAELELTNPDFMGGEASPSV